MRGRLRDWVRPRGVSGELLVGPLDRLAPASLLLGALVCVLVAAGAADDALRRLGLRA